MVNFAEHIHDIDPITYRCRICGIDEIKLFMLTFYGPGVELEPGETIEQFVDRHESRKRAKLDHS